MAIPEEFPSIPCFLDGEETGMTHGYTVFQRVAIKWYVLRAATVILSFIYVRHQALLPNSTCYHTSDQHPIFVRMQSELQGFKVQTSLFVGYAGFGHILSRITSSFKNILSCSVLGRGMQRKTIATLAALI